jgi:glyoxylase-like metal-dependent hydrolase (beta-lactamase superfamily II)
VAPVTAWTDLGGGAHVRQSRVFRMNSALLLDREHAVLVDPGVLPSELDDLAAAVRETRPRALTLVFTHSHWDHVLGRPWWPQAGTVGHAGLGAELRRDAASILAEACGQAARSGEAWSHGFQPFEPDLAVEDGRTIALGPWRLTLREARGHCDSQITVQLPDRGLLIAGDLLSDLEIPWLDREPAACRATLRGLLRLAEGGGIATLVPGHGTIAHGPEALARIHRDLGYLDALESGVGEARTAGLSLEQTLARLTVMDYLGKGAAYPMDDVHRENVRLAWEASGRGPA